MTAYLGSARLLHRDGLRARPVHIDRSGNVANQVGKRYQCGKCGTEMIVTKGGDGQLSCCGQPMEQKQ